MKKPVESLDPDRLEALRADWRAGLLPARTIAVKFGVDVAGLRLYALQNGWESSDLTAEVQQSHDRALVQRTVSEDDAANGRTAPRVIDSHDMVEQYGAIVAQVTDTQRKAVGRARSYVTSLFEQLEQLHGPQVDEAALQALAGLVAQDHPQLAESLTKVNDPVPFKERLKVLDTKATIIDKLARGIKLLIELERQVWGIDNKAGEKHTDYDALLDRLQAITQRPPPQRVQ